MTQERLFSGARASGKLHIGNYFGALKNWLSLVKKYDSIFAVVDLHSITTPYSPDEMPGSIKTVLLDYLSVGLDPDEVNIVLQSHIPEHLELSWVLSTLATPAELERMPTYKEKIADYPKDTNMALMNYPILMAADILIYKSAVVPVGEDQDPHIEFTRVLARRFNQRYGETFPEPKSHRIPAGARIKSLVDPAKKMSKTGGAGINLCDTPEEITKKIKKAVTDSGSEIKSVEDKPALTNLLNIYSLMINRPVADIEAEFVGKGYGDFKNSLAEVIIEGLRPMREKRAELEKDNIYLTKVLKDGAEYARPIAQETLKEVKEKIGLHLPWAK